MLIISYLKQLNFPAILKSKIVLTQYMNYMLHDKKNEQASDPFCFIKRGEAILSLVTFSRRKIKTNITHNF